MTGPNSPVRSRRRRSADAPIVLLPLDPAAASPLHRQVYDGLRESILASRLPPGARLPSTRAFAADLGVARNTVVLAYDQLRTEGYIEGQRGGGTRVRSVIPEHVLHVRSRPRGARPDTRSLRSLLRDDIHPSSLRSLPRDDIHPSPLRSLQREEGRRAAGGETIEARVSARGAMLVAAGAALPRRGGTVVRPFRLGVPAIDAFPSRLWARLTARRWRQDDVHLGDADPLGEPALRAAIAAYVTTSRGARCTADQVFIVNGTQHALDLVARVLLDPGDAAWVEDPGYLGARAALAAAGARIVPVPVDENGLDVAAGERAAPRARLAYVTPSHQFPLGAVMCAPRRLALLAWARRARAWIVEDDYDSEFRYAGRPLPCLQGLDAEERPAGEPSRVLYVGTFSKTLVPGLRLGYLVVPDALVDSLRAARAATERHPPTFMQGVLTDFIAEGHYARLLRRVRSLYAERQSMLIEAAEESLGGLLTLAPDAAGLHLVGRLAAGLTDTAVTEAASREGVEVFPLSRCTFASSSASTSDALLLSYAGFEGGAIRDGVRRLRRALESEMKLSKATSRRR